MDFKKLIKKAEQIKDKVDIEEIKDKLDDVDVKGILTKFIQSKKEGEKLDGDTNLFEKGFVNSMFSLEIITFIEKTFKIKIPKSEITKDNLSSINKITALVKKLKK